jgi:hypothetical protein
MVWRWEDLDEFWISFGDVLEMFWRRFWRWIRHWIGSCWVVCLWVGFVFLDLDCVFGIVILSSPLFAVFSLSTSPLSAILSCHRRVFFAACAVYPLVCAIFALFSFGALGLSLFDAVVTASLSSPLSFLFVVFVPSAVARAFTSCVASSLAFGMSTNWPCGCFTNGSFCVLGTVSLFLPVESCLRLHHLFWPRQRDHSQ